MEKLYQIAPNFLQNLLVTAYNMKSYRTRYGGAYKKYLKLFKERDAWSLEQLKEDQEQRFQQLFLHAITASPFYKDKFQSVPEAPKVGEIAKLPIINKEQFRTHQKDIYTIPKSAGVVAKTGGTTGKSLEVIFTNDNMQERFAMLDNFRSRFGYELGKKTAWFSGKNILTSKDVSKNRFWKTDFFYKVRYYSTFHIKKEYLPSYVENLLKYQPEYIVGFPSSIYEIASQGIQSGRTFDKGIVKAIFPTAESVTSLHREVIETFFNAPIYDQYASSEGAPFIFECEQRKLHLELQSGVFEVLDSQHRPANKGKLIMTSFTTYGTPLIRYDIGDALKLADGSCSCGNNNPLVHKILGRTDDYLYSPENGKINLGNISNTLKDTYGIIKFQATQRELNSIVIQMVIDAEVFDSNAQRIFEKNWTDRLGSQMKLHFEQVETLGVEASGKFRLIKNEIKHLID